MTERAEHKWGAYKGIPYPVCINCGLMLMRNRLTALAVRRGCDHSKDADWPSQVKRLTALERE